MSRWLGFADALAEHIRATVPACSPLLPEMERVPVIVDRQKDIATEVAKAVGRAKGAVVTVLWTGGRNPDPNATRLLMGGNYSLTVRGVPVINNASRAIPLDELCEQVAEAAHHYTPGLTANERTRRLEITEVEMMPDARLLVYEITGTVMRVVPSASDRWEFDPTVWGSTADNGFWQD